MSVPPVNIAEAVANPRLLDESGIMVNVGELRKLVELAEYGEIHLISIGRAYSPPPAVDDLDESDNEPLRMADVDAGGNAD